MCVYSNSFRHCLSLRISSQMYLNMFAWDATYVGLSTDEATLSSLNSAMRRRSLAAKCVEGIIADSLNNHYASTSTDSAYCPPSITHSAFNSVSDSISEWQVFRALDTQHSTFPGLDNLPAWFLRLGAHIFCKPLTHPF